MRANLAVALLALCTVPATQAALTIQSCTVSNSSINFGIYNPLDPLPNDNNAGSVTLSCNVAGNGAVPIDVALGVSGGTFAERRLVNGTSSLAYNIFTSATYSTVWGDGSAGSTLQFGAITKSVTSVTWPLYGRIPADQLTAVPGNYVDTVQVTVSW